MRLGRAFVARRTAETGETEQASLTQLSARETPDSCARETPEQREALLTVLAMYCDLRGRIKGAAHTFISCIVVCD